MKIDKLIKDLGVSKNPVHLIDVGASGGIHERWFPLRDVLVVIGFEPDEREFHKLKPSKNEVWYNTALYADNTEHNLYVTRWQTNTSLLKPNYPIIERFCYPNGNDFEIVKTLKIKCRKLDDVLDEKGLQLDAIKLDTQGSELFILQGAARYLQDCVFAVESEVEFIKLYEDQPLFRDVDFFMQSKGFQLIDCGNLTYIKGANTAGIGGEKGQLTSADALYFKSVQSVKQTLGENGQEKLAAIIMICLAYGYPDYALEVCKEVEKEDLIEKDLLKSWSSILSQCRHYSALIPGFPGRARLVRMLSGASAMLGRFSHANWLNPLGNSIRFLKK